MAEVLCLGCGNAFEMTDFDQRCSSCVESGTGPEPVKHTCTGAGGGIILTGTIAPCPGCSQRHAMVFKKERQVLDAVRRWHTSQGLTVMGLEYQTLVRRAAEYAELLGDVKP